MKKIISIFIFALLAFSGYSQRINNVDRPTRFINGTYFGENGVIVDSIKISGDTLYFYVNSAVSPFKAIYNPSTSNIKASAGLTFINDTMKWGGTLDEDVDIEGGSYNVTIGYNTPVGIFSVNSDTTKINGDVEIDFKANGTTWIFNGDYWYNSSDTLATFQDVRDLIFGELGISVENGLTISGSTIKQGGILSENTSILGGGYDHQIGTSLSRAGTVSKYGESYASDMTNNYTWSINNGTYELTFDGQQLKIDFDTLITFSEARLLFASLEQEIIIPFNYNYTLLTTTADSRPGVGNFKLNNATYSLVDSVFIDDFDESGISRSDFFSLVDTGSYFTITDGVSYINYKILNATDGGLYTKYKVSYINNNGVVGGSLTLNIDNTGGGGASVDSLYYSNKSIWLGNKDTLTIDTLEYLSFDGGTEINSTKITTDTLDADSIFTNTVQTDSVKFGSDDYIWGTDNYIETYVTGPGAIDQSISDISDDTYSGTQLVTGSESETIWTSYVNSSTKGYFLNNWLEHGLSFNYWNGVSDDTIFRADEVYFKSYVPIIVKDSIVFNGDIKIKADAGSDNISLGQYSWTEGSNGFSNIDIGNSTSFNRTTASYNTGVGNTVNQSLTSGIRNTALGYSALNNNETGSYNIAIGNNAGAGVGSFGPDYSYRLFISSVPNKTTMLEDSTESIIYGYMDEDVTKQRLYLNANTYISEDLTIDGLLIAEKETLDTLAIGDVELYADTDTLKSPTFWVRFKGFLGDIFTAQKITTDTLVLADSTLTGTVTLKSAVEATEFAQFNFKDTTITAGSDGRLHVDGATHSLVFNNDISGFNHNLGYEFVRRVYNGTGSTIPDGTPVRKVGTYKNGEIIASVALAGNSTYDSSKVYGITTVSIAPGAEGIVTRGGDIRGLDLSALNDTIAYLGFGGSIIDTCPPPPYFCAQLGEIIYADADSGQIDVDIKEVSYSPSPLFAADTSGLNQNVAISTINVYEKLPLGDNKIDNNIGFTVAGDSVQVLASGYYQIVLSMSFQGNPTTEVWHYAAFVNNIALPYKERSTGSSATGDVNNPISRRLSEGDWISFRIKNTSGTGDPTIQTMAIQIIYLSR